MVGTQNKQLDRQKRKMRKLLADNQALEEQVQDQKKEITKTKRELTRTKHKLEEVQEALRVARLPANSSNSSRPPSTDIYKPRRSNSYSLRQKTGRKPGGQPGHKGSTLEFCTDAPDQEIEHMVERCTACGKDLSGIAGERDSVHQVVDIAIPKRILINHTTITKYCTCGKCNKASFPPGAKGPVNYGNKLRGLVANLSVRQHMPYKREVEFIEDIFGIKMSQGTVTNLLGQVEQSARATYEQIQQEVGTASVVGADETGAKVNGARNWFHVYQTPEQTFIGFHPSRGTDAQETFYPIGFPESTLVSDCLHMQLSTPAKRHQACHPHLERELKAMEEAWPKEQWPKKTKTLFKAAVALQNTDANCKEIQKIESQFKRLITTDQSEAPGKISAFWKRMNKHSDKIFTFLYYPDVPANNNASERAIRCIKVKQKVSGQFKTEKGAHQFAVIRSVIDTLIKQNKNVHEGLAHIASFAPS
jgi:transposase